MLEENFFARDQQILWNWYLCHETDYIIVRSLTVPRAYDTKESVNIAKQVKACDVKQIGTVIWQPTVKPKMINNYIEEKSQ